MSRETDYDVVVLGSGTAGLAGALAAKEMGLAPIVLEKAAMLGGMTTNSYGLVWVGDNHLARAAGYQDSRDEIQAYMRFLGGGELSEERMSTFVDRAPEAIRFFTERGIGLRVVHGVTDHYYGRAPGAHTEGRSLEAELISGFELGAWRERILMPPDVPCFVTAEEQVGWGGVNRFSQWDQNLVAERRARDMRGKGVGLISHFVKALAARDVPIRTEVAVASLLVEDKRVVGVVLADGSQLRARKGVIIATGGYEANAELATELEGLPGLAEPPNPLAPASMTGDGLVLGAEIGAVIHRIQNNLTVMLGYTIAADEPGAPAISVHAGIVELCSPHTLVVNRKGLRFADESYFQGIVPALRHFDAMTRDHPNLPAYLIFDRQYLRDFSFANLPVGAPVPKAVPVAATLAELAAKLRLDPDRFCATIERFNRFARAGLDEDFHRGEQRWRLAARDAAKGSSGLGTIEEPPFYGVELHPTIANSAGLLTNIAAQVIHQRRHPIPGLYASGVAATRDEVGAGYQAGLTLSSGMTFSYLAVRHMLGR
jgi:3-oxosteroid 1-dehydrogenase